MLGRSRMEPSVAPNAPTQPPARAKVRRNVSLGIVAQGRIAVGVVAMGGIAFGVVAIGGIALGVIALGGVVAGGLAVGGVAFGWRVLGALAFGVACAPAASKWLIGFCMPFRAVLTRRSDGRPASTDSRESDLVAR